jgi:hypothetical protein
MESFICFMGKVLEPLGQVVVSLIAAFGENSETARTLRTSQRERDEWKTRCLAAESRLAAEQEKSARLRAVTVVLFATVLFCEVFPNRTVLVGAVGLSFALGGLLLPEAIRLGEFVSKGRRLGAQLWQSAHREICSVSGHFMKLLERVRRTTRDWCHWMRSESESQFTCAARLPVKSALP